MVAAKQRLSFYKELLKVVCEDPDTSLGFCHYISCSMDHWYKKNSVYPLYAYHPLTFRFHLHELYAVKPTYTVNGYWFPTTKAGWQKRINLLHSVIVKMETSKK